MDEELDAILSECLLDFENFADLPLVSCPDPTQTNLPLANHAFGFDPVPPTSEHRLASSSSSSSSRFAELKTDSQLEQAKANSIPCNTKKNTSWAVNVWKAWSAHRREKCSYVSEWPVHLFLAQPHELDYWLSKFVLEARKANGEPYPPDTLYVICAGLLRYIREKRPEINIFKDHQYTGFRKTLDGEMKRLRSAGIGVKRKQAEPITIEEENKLWERGALGEHDPQTLLDTMLFLCGIHFALRSGQEHCNLRLSQFEVQNSEEGSDCLIYTENTSKNNQGGLAHRKIKQKMVTCYANEDNPQRCLVRLFQVFVGHRPAECDDAFYLTPLKKPKGELWYSKMPVGHNTLSKTIGRLCTAANISGFKTNHSLRVTTATRLFNSGVDEQLIMSHTGHRSVDGVRSYKRESEAQKRSISTVLNSASNGQPVPYHVQVSKKAKLDEENSASNAEYNVEHYNPQQAVATTTTAHATTVNFNFSGCSSITINYSKD